MFAIKEYYKNQGRQMEISGSGVPAEGLAEGSG
jgi:hypothetical protein